MRGVSIAGFELLLNDVQLVDSGMYQCFVTNDVSTSSSVARLTVNKKPTTTIGPKPTSRPTDSGQWKNYAPGSHLFNELFKELQQDISVCCVVSELIILS